MNNSQSNSINDPAPTAESSTKQTFSRRVGRAMFIFIAIPYLAVLALLFIFQRKLIYHPGPKEILNAEHLDQQNVRDIAVPVAENHVMNGWHFHPIGHSDEAKLSDDDWLVLFFHGNGGNRSTRTYLCDPLSLTHKLHVIICDYRGYGDNAGSPNEQALCADAEALWNYVIKEKGATPERIILYGQSLGGGVATHLAAYACRQNQPPGSLVVSGTFSSLADTAQDKYPAFPVRWLLFDQFDSAAKMPAITCPVVQIHGAADEIVPLAIGRKLHAVTPAHSADGTPKRFVELERVGHNDLPAREIIRAIVNVTHSTPTGSHSQ